MCKYSLHHLACKHVKVKVDERCYFQTSDQTDRQYCILTPPPNFDILHGEIRLLPYPKDGVTTFVRETYGPGVCENMHCRRAFGLLPQDESEDGSDEPYVVDDTPYDMSELACSTREMAWWSSLSDDDSQEALRFAIANGMIFDTNSNHGFPAMQDYMSELILFDLSDWRTLNPRFMTAEQLWLCVPNHLFLQVTIPRPRPLVSRLGPPPLASRLNPRPLASHLDPRPLESRLGPRTPQSRRRPRSRERRLEPRSLKARPQFRTLKGRRQPRSPESPLRSRSLASRLPPRFLESRDQPTSLESRLQPPSSAPRLQSQRAVSTFVMRPQDGVCRYHRKYHEAAPRTPSPVVQSQLNEGNATSMGNNQDVLMSEEPTSAPRKRKREVDDIRANLSDSDSCDMDMTD
ncbi:hypothetical protein LTR50_004028 [Elasticomyces elasticus]|nr:hypothetical protein LTR50_004028 [Elasticomyces elasticus]